MAETLRKMAKSPALFPPPRRGGGNNTILFRFIRVRALMAEGLKGNRDKNSALLTMDKFGYKMSMEGGTYDVAY